jgi:hypothetical protein
MPFQHVLPRSFSVTGIHEHAPSLPGVFGVSNAREWIYIGVADNIRQTLLGLLGGADDAVRRHGPTGFVFEICEHSEREQRQDRLVFEYEPVCNRYAQRGV